ncbi:hypothetical protein [Devosia sp. LjRoot3]|uniref:hypothetical protein n=1 Tax=Devosia sp. LjRoot3 TaxID=3342319 RepID=UPI003ED0260E
MHRNVFKPYATLGELLVLAKVGAFHASADKKVTTDALLKDLKASKDSVATAFRILDEAFGDVEVKDTAGRGTRQPTLRGRNIGGSAVLADLLIKIAQDPQTDQNALLVTLVDTINYVRKNYESGAFLSTPKKEF